MKVAIVGCGKISDEHANAIRSIPDSAIVGVCDREELMARQMAGRFEGVQPFSDLEHMLQSVKPDVVHVTTPPGSHLVIGRACLEAGVHVLVEKPFGLTAREATSLIELAQQRERLLTVGHDHQFSHVATQMRHMVADGFLGGRPVHMESIYCYDMSDARYAKAVVEDKKHWVRKLPGKLVHNIISHAACKIAEFVEGIDPQVSGVGFISPFLRDLGETELVDELRITIRDEADTTAYLSFSSQMSPGVHQFRLFGPKNSLTADFGQQVLIPHVKRSDKSYLAYFRPPWTTGKHYMKGALRNQWRFLRNRFHQDRGRRVLISKFYQSIQTGGAPPIPYREIICTANIMDAIFREVYGANSGNIR